MIAKLNGILDSVAADHAVIDVGGVGYLAFCSARTLARLPAAGTTVSLAVETHVREDHIHLYGFLDALEREWFRLLLTVQGIGAKSALAILGAIGPEDLALAIASQDRAMITRAPGVGPKLASRLLVELKDKTPAMPIAGARALAGRTADTSADAVSALVNLGYKRSEAFQAVAEAQGKIGREASVEALVRAGLKELSR